MPRRFGGDVGAGDHGQHQRRQAGDDAGADAGHRAQQAGGHRLARRGQLDAEALLQALRDLRRLAVQRLGLRHHLAPEHRRDQPDQREDGEARGQSGMR